MRHYTSFNTKLLNYTAGIICLLVLAYFALLFHKSKNTPKDYSIYTASFDNADGLTPKTPIMLSGYTVGHIISVTLDKDYNVVTKMIIKKSVEIPDDSTLNIKEDGFFGNKVIELNLGVDDELLVNHDEFSSTTTGIPLVKVVDLLISYVGSLKEQVIKLKKQSHISKSSIYSNRTEKTITTGKVKPAHPVVVAHSPTVSERKVVSTKTSTRQNKNNASKIAVVKTTQVTTKVVQAVAKPQTQHFKTSKVESYVATTQHTAKVIPKKAVAGKSVTPKVVTKTLSSTHKAPVVVHRKNLQQKSIITKKVVTTEVVETKPQANKQPSHHINSNLVVKPLAPVIVAHGGKTIENTSTAQQISLASKANPTPTKQAAKTIYKRTVVQTQTSVATKEAPKKLILTKPTPGQIVKQTSVVSTYKGPASDQPGKASGVAKGL